MQAVPIQLERATAAGGETGALVRAFDWSRTPLGPMATWPIALQTAVSTCLSTSFPMVVNWGSQLIQIYNDAAVPVYGQKHPAAMGRPARMNFPEFWEFTGVEGIQKHIFENALPFRAEDERLLVDRKGFLEETYFTFSLSPILDDDGTVLGVLNTYVETTSRVLGERRMATLRELAERAVRARNTEEACAEAVTALKTNPYDLRFVLLYRVDGDGSSATLAGSTGIVEGGTAAPRTLTADRPAKAAFVWPLESVLRTREVAFVGDLPSKVDLGPRSGRTSPPRDALVLPLMRSGDAVPAGILVVGLSPRVPLDDAYRGFLKLVAAQIAAGLLSAEAYHEASERAERLAEIDRAKSVFYSNISHEFRTPLTLLLGPVEDLLREDDGPLTSPQRDRLLALRRNALRLLRLVSGLLDLARVEGGSLDLHSETTDLASLTREVASTFSSAMSTAGLHFDVDCPRSVGDVRIDRGVWEAIVLNLLSNALKYTPRGGVTLTLRRAGDRVRLAVRDTGVGVAESALPHIFERFYRSRESTARSIEGTGIGLALVHEFARALGGEVRVESAPGEGSTFTVEIPVEGAARASAAEGIARLGAQGMTPAFVNEAESWVEPRTAAAPPRLAPERGPSLPRVLVVEDNADMRQYLVHVLSRDYRVQAVADGSAALDAAMASTPDVVLSDVLMPGIDGLALVRALRANAKTRSVPAILLTARAGEDAALEGLGTGADDYILKPFSSRELRARVGTHLELARKRREVAESTMKDTFMSVASHELRTPLMTLKLQLELLMRDAIREPQGRAHPAGAQLDAIRRAIVRMEAVVDELLTVSAVKTGAFALHPEPEDLASICRVAADEQMLLSQRRVAVELPAEPTIAFVDPQRVQQVVSSLLSNALKYSPPDSQVALRLQRTDAEAVIAVRDEGPGIPADALPHLFDRFYHVPGIEARVGSRTGLGLGLFISQAIVSCHGGRIEVESRPGRGSTFSVRLPLAEASAHGGGS